MPENNRYVKKVMLTAVFAFMVTAPLHALAAQKLIVNAQDGTTSGFTVADSPFTTTESFVGIGTSAPTSSIHVKSPTVQFPANAIKVEGSEVTKGGGFVAYENRTDSQLCRANDRLGFIYFGSNAQNLQFHPAGFEAKAEGDWTSTSTPANFIFGTTAPGTYGTPGRVERFRISASGNIGVSTTTPQATLDINGSVRINPTNNLPPNAPVPSKPACTDSNRGTMWFTQGVGTAKDSFEICAADNTGVAAWRSFY